MIDPQDWFREPDIRIGRVAPYAVWYGPAGPKGDCATEVEYDYGTSYRVAEYYYVGGLIENLDENRPFLKISTYVEARNVREAAAIGTQQIAEQGGSEEFVSELPA